MRDSLAYVLVRCDLKDELEKIFDELFGSDPSPGSNWIASLMLRSEVTAYLGEKTHAERLYGELLPYAELTGMVGWLTVCFGSVSRSLGLLAHTYGDLEAAERHFQRAIAVNERLRARPWVARCQLEYAQMLAGAGRSTCARASELARRAHATAESLDIPDLIRAARTVE